MSFYKAKYIKKEDLINYDYNRLDKLILESKSIISNLLDISPRNCIAYSGGKDSLVTTHLSTSLGITDAVTEMSFHFSSSIEHIKSSAKWFNLNITYKHGLNWDWLKRNQKYCACEPKLQSQIYAARQQRTVKKHTSSENYTGVLYGRRTQENTVRKSLYQLADNIWQCHPLRNWKTKDVWAYIYKFNLPYPELYLHEIGIKEGFTPFLLIPSSFADNCVWKPMYEIEPNIVKKFAEFHAPAKQYLNSLK